MKKTIWRSLLVMLGFVFVALAQKQTLHKSKGMSAVGKETWLLLALMACVVGVFFGYLFFLSWRRAYRRERRFQRRVMDNEHEEQVELLQSRISMLQLANQNLQAQPLESEIAERNESLATQLREAQTALRDFMLDMKESVAFDREVAVELPGGRRYVFVFKGCKFRHDGAGFLGFYDCPMCLEKPVEVSESDVFDAKFRDHLEKCSGLNRTFAVGS